MSPKMTVITFATKVLKVKLHPAQAMALRALYALPPVPGDLDLFQALTGREEWPTKPYTEAVWIWGVRSGKDFVAAVVVLYEALLGGHEAKITQGERVVIPLVAQDFRGTEVLYGYVRGHLEASHMLADEVDERTRKELTLTNGVKISCFPAVANALRGWSSPLAVMDEAAFLPPEGAVNSDTEIRTALRTRMATFDTRKLLIISSAYAEQGLVYDRFKTFYGSADPDVLIVKGRTIDFNPALAEAVEQERRLLRGKDDRVFLREYESTFAASIEGFVPLALIEAQVVKARQVLPPDLRYMHFAGIDTSNGGGDAFTLAIVRVEDGHIVQVFAASWGRARIKEIRLEGVVEECTLHLSRYGLVEAFGDHNAKDWVIEAFAKRSITFRHPEADRTGCYESLAAQLHRVDLLDVPEQIKQFARLERRISPSGKTIIDHPRNAHDDLINALGVAVFRAAATVELGEVRAARQAREAEEDVDAYYEWGRWTPAERAEKFRELDEYLARGLAAGILKPEDPQRLRAEVGRNLQKADQIIAQIEGRLSAAGKDALGDRLRRAFGDNWRERL